MDQDALPEECKPLRFLVTLTNGTPGTIRLEGSSNVRDKIETKVKEGELIIKFKNYKIASRMNSKQ